MSQIQEVRVPDIGDFDEATVVEVLVAVGDQIAVDDSLITLETDKASMEVPSTMAGVVREIKVSDGDEVGQDAVILLLETAGSEAVASGDGGSEAATSEAAASEDGGSKAAAEPAAPAVSAEASAPAATSGTAAAASQTAPASTDEAVDSAYASPAVRKLSRELEVDLAQISGTGRGGRITKDDLHGLIKRSMAGGGTGGTGGFDWPQMPNIDYSRYGETERRPLSRIQKVSARNLHRSWLHVPHVTQHDEADTTEMEAFRKAHSEEAKKLGFKLTPLAFLLKAAAKALQEFPTFNSSLSPAGDELILKRYVNIGVAVDTPDGLVVPVIRDVASKGLYELAGEVVAASIKARDGKLMPADFQGGCFTISSLGGIGGTAFTPIVNAPEVAILGVSRSTLKPVWNGEAFEPRLMLPLSVSYDHRVIDGATACRFTVYLARLLSDLRRLLL